MMSVIKCDKCKDKMFRAFTYDEKVRIAMKEKNNNVKICIHCVLHLQKSTAHIFEVDRKNVIRYKKVSG